MAPVKTLVVEVRPMAADAGVVQLRLGDITAQPDLDAVVNAANAQLLPGGGVAGAIHRAAGPELAAACRPLAPIEPGTCVVTPAFGLPNRHVVHCLGPVYGRDEPAPALLAACYRGALDQAAAAGCTSIGFPAISTGVFGYPVAAAAQVALTTVLEVLDAGAVGIDVVRFVLFSPSDLAIHEQVLRELGGGV